MLFDLAGDKVFMGSDFGAQVINPTNFGTSNNPYTSLGTVTGNVLAVSNNGTVAVFSDTIHTPNQVYVVNVANVDSPTATALNISSAVAAAFSPDGLKTFILGGTTASSLYVYSTLQALQGPIALPGPGKGGRLLAQWRLRVCRGGGLRHWLGQPYRVCHLQQSGSPRTLPLPADPILMKVLPQVAHRRQGFLRKSDSRWHSRA